MNDYKIVWVLVAILVIVGFFWVRSLNRIFVAEERAKKKLGTVYVLNNDTLKIIDYSLINETYTLSNGTKISIHLIK